MLRRATKRPRTTGRVAPHKRAMNSRRALLGNPFLRDWNNQDVERLQQGIPRLRTSFKFTMKGTQREITTLRRTVSGTISSLKDIDLAISKVATTPHDARLAKVVWETSEGGSKCWFNPEGLPAEGRYQIDSDCITLIATPGNTNATVSIDPSDACPDLQGHQVLLPADEDTTITFTTTAEDGYTTSTNSLIAVRSH